MLTLRAYNPANDDDIAAIARIYAHHVLHGRASFETEAPTTGEMRRRLDALVETGYPVLVAMLDGILAGYAYGSPFHPRQAYRRTVEDSIYVDHRLPRRGVGRALLTELLEQLRAAEFQQVMAVIGDSANAGSIELHRALGFRHVGTAHGIGFKFGEYLDVVYMQLALQQTGDG
ncbi:MAG: GNAT family N-acetyltransferase [Pseudomonadota bacterium]|nr:GNAT family N-acetyltransferase [Pseudomonadota bacterium]